MTWDPLGRVLLILIHLCTFHPPAATPLLHQLILLVLFFHPLITSTHFTCVVFSLANDTHMLCEHIFVPMQAPTVGAWLLTSPNTLSFLLSSTHFLTSLCIHFDIPNPVVSHFGTFYAYISL
jgi:hypothetical protein